jgi:hypothetical protein
MIAVGTYWWTELPNWGDRLTPFLLERFAKIRAVHTDPTSSSLISLGSIIEHMPPGWHGVVAGAGFIREDSPSVLGHANIQGVRGPLTARKLSYRPDAVAIGDPGLLADELVPLPEKEYDLGILPHVNDHELNQMHDWRGSWSVRYINPLDDPLSVVKAIGSCRKLVTSSLHGLIVADAFGVPRRFEPNDAWLSNPHEGGLFKFQDYHQSIGMKLVPGVVGTPVRAQVEDRKHEVYDMLGDLSRWLP